MATASDDKYGVVLRRGRRYRYRNTVYLRNEPAVVDQDVRDHLVGATGFFMDILLDENGTRIEPETVPQKVKVAERVRIRAGRKAGNPELLDTGAAAVTATEAEQEGAAEV